MIVWGLMIKFKLDDIKSYKLEFGGILPARAQKASKFKSWRV